MFLFLVDLLHTFVLDRRRSSLNLNLADRSFGFLTFIWADEDSDPVKVVEVAVVVGLLWGVADDTAEVVDRHAVTVQPVFAFEFVARHPEINAGNPGVLDWIGDH